MKKRDFIIMAIVFLMSFVFFSGCQRTPEEMPLEELTVTEFLVAETYPDHNQVIQENHLYLIDSQEKMDEVFATYPSDYLPNVNFNEQSVLVVWGAYCHSRSDVSFVKVDNNNYEVNVLLVPSIDCGPDFRWAYACTTNRKLTSNEHVTLKIVEE